MSPKLGGILMFFEVGIMRSIVRNLFFALAFLTLAGGAANAQSFAGGKHPSNLRDTEDQIFHKIVMLPNYGLWDHITYQVSGGTVTLAGSTYSLGTKKEAERVVKRVPGVDNVVNNIRELPPSPLDDQIRRQLVVRISEMGGLSRYLETVNPPVRLIVDHGHVALEGVVSTRSDANMMRIAALGVPGVFTVENHLIVKDEMVR
jgi:hypothetical protein